MLKKAIVCGLLVVGLSAKAEFLPLQEKFIAAEIQVESGGNDKSVGDGGKAIGCLQIHKQCWKDSKTYGDYSNCLTRTYSVQIITSYLNKYCKNAIKLNDFETMARTWNSGPSWRKHPKASNGYWLKIKKELN